MGLDSVSFEGDVNAVTDLLETIYKMMKPGDVIIGHHAPIIEDAFRASEHLQELFEYSEYALDESGFVTVFFLSKK